MTLSALLNRPLTLVSRSNGTTDVYGNPVPAETQTAVLGELQQIRRTEPGDQGELSDTGWLLILPAGTTIHTGDAVIAGQEVYEVVGDPWEARNPRTQAVSHVEATLRRTGSTGDEA